MHGTRAPNDTLTAVQTAPTFLTTHDAAVLVCVSAKTVRRWIKAGRLKGYRVGRHYRVRQDELLRAMEPIPRPAVRCPPTLPPPVCWPPNAS